MKTLNKINTQDFDNAKLLSIQGWGSEQVSLPLPFPGEVVC